MSRGYDGPEIDDFRGSGLAGNAAQIDISLRIGEVGLLFIISIGKKTGPTDATAKLVNAATKTVRLCNAKNGSGKSFPSESEPNTQTGTGNIPCGILRSTRWEKWANSALFRTNDLAEFAYNGDRSRVENDVQSLARQGLVQETTIADPEHNPTQVVTLTKEGHNLLSRGKGVDSSQAAYHGLKKPKEAFHDADLYRLYYKVSDEIESRGGSVVRVKLDYELKRELYAHLARAAADKRRERDTLREEVAKRYHLKVVSGRIPIPDLRIEYVNENDNASGIMW